MESPSPTPRHRPVPQYLNFLVEAAEAEDDETTDDDICGAGGKSGTTPGKGRRSMETFGLEDPRDSPSFSTLGAAEQKKQLGAFRREVKKFRERERRKNERSAASKSARPIAPRTLLLLKELGIASILAEGMSFKSKGIALMRVKELAEVTQNVPRLFRTDEATLIAGTCAGPARQQQQNAENASGLNGQDSDDNADEIKISDIAQVSRVDLRHHRRHQRQPGDGLGAGDGDDVSDGNGATADMDKDASTLLEETNFKRQQVMSKFQVKEGDFFVIIRRKKVGGERAFVVETLQLPAIDHGTVKAKSSCAYTSKDMSIVLASHPGVSQMNMAEVLGVIQPYVHFVPSSNFLSRVRSHALHAVYGKPADNIQLVQGLKERLAQSGSVFDYTTIDGTAMAQVVMDVARSEYTSKRREALAVPESERTPVQDLAARPWLNYGSQESPMFEFLAANEVLLAKISGFGSNAKFVTEFFFAPHESLSQAPTLLKVLSMDAADCKGVGNQCVLFSISGLSSNGDWVPLVYCWLSLTESETSWKKVLEFLKSAYSNMDWDSFSVLIDADKGMEGAIQSVLPSLRPSQQTNGLAKASNSATQAQFFRSVDPVSSVIGLAQHVHETYGKFRDLANSDAGPGAASQGPTGSPAELLTPWAARKLNESISMIHGDATFEVLATLSDGGFVRVNDGDEQFVVKFEIPSHQNPSRFGSCSCSLPIRDLWPCWHMLAASRAMAMAYFETVPYGYWRTRWREQYRTAYPSDGTNAASNIMASTELAGGDNVFPPPTLAEINSSCTRDNVFKEPIFAPPQRGRIPLKRRQSYLESHARKRMDSAQQQQ